MQKAAFTLMECAANFIHISGGVGLFWQLLACWTGGSGLGGLGVLSPFQAPPKPELNQTAVTKSSNFLHFCHVCPDPRFEYQTGVTKIPLFRIFCHACLVPY